ncbi:MAG: pyruvate kinase [Thermodesulfobacteriota bacterium]|nr:pyruvate kinase [Thermodesulfobacteriota bacterium]
MSGVTRTRKTKIVCTIGPATSSPEMIRRLIKAGMNVARLNFSHGDHESHGRVIRELRSASRELGREIGVLMDLAGPKIRIGEISGSERRLESGGEVALVSGRSCAGDELPVNYPYLYDDVEAGNSILIADGQVELLVKGKKDGQVHCRVVAGGVITSHKGVNLPTSDLRIQALTDKDCLDLEFGLKEEVDFVALSFVRHERDLAPVREIISRLDRPPLLIAKIEKPQALDRLENILKVVEGVMVARGDLGVEMPLEEVPFIQKRVIQEARRAGKVVITATQMLVSMVNNPRPTRAEVTDTANAVLDGTDAVMLSEETTIGSYPVKAVKVLDKVCRLAEPYLDTERFLSEEFSRLLPPTDSAISRAASWLAKDLDPAAIMAATTSGSTARLIARYRPPYPVVGLSSEPRTCRQLCLSWGVKPALILTCGNTEELAQEARRWASEIGLAAPGDSLILTAGVPLAETGRTNMIKVIEMDGPRKT